MAIKTLKNLYLTSTAEYLAGCVSESCDDHFGSDIDAHRFDFTGGEWAGAILTNEVVGDTIIWGAEEHRSQRSLNAAWSEITGACEE